MPEDTPGYTVRDLSNSGSRGLPGYITVRDTARPAAHIIPTILIIPIIPIRTGISPRATAAAVGEATITTTISPDPHRVPAITAAVHSGEEARTEEASAAVRVLQGIREVRTAPAPAANPHSEALIPVRRAHILQDRAGRGPRVHTHRAQVHILQDRALILLEGAAAPAGAVRDDLNRNQYKC